MLFEVVCQGLVSEVEIDDVVICLFIVWMCLGMFDLLEWVCWVCILVLVNQVLVYDVLVFKVVQVLLVLLKNDGILLLLCDIKCIVVVGFIVDDIMVLFGNYFGILVVLVIILQGICEVVKGVEVCYVRGVDLVEGCDDFGVMLLIELIFLWFLVDLFECGLCGEYFCMFDLFGVLVLVCIDVQIGFCWDRGLLIDNLLVCGEVVLGQGIFNDCFSICWSG